MSERNCDGTDNCPNALSNEAIENRDMRDSLLLARDSFVKKYGLGNLNFSANRVKSHAGDEWQINPSTATTLLRIVKASGVVKGVREKPNTWVVTASQRLALSALMIEASHNTTNQPEKVDLSIEEGLKILVESTRIALGMSCLRNHIFDPDTVTEDKRRKEEVKRAQQMSVNAKNTEIEAALDNTPKFGDLIPGVNAFSFTEEVKQKLAGINLSDLTREAVLFAKKGTFSDDFSVASPNSALFLKYLANVRLENLKDQNKVPVESNDYIRRDSELPPNTVINLVKKLHADHKIAVVQSVERMRTAGKLLNLTEEKNGKITNPTLLLLLESVIKQRKDQSKRI